MINKKISTLLAAGALALGTLQAQAASVFTDADNWGTTFLVSGASVGGTFDIVNEDAQADLFTVDGTVYSTLTQNGGDTFDTILGYNIGDPVIGGTVNFWFQATSGDTFNILVGLVDILQSNNGVVSFVSQGLNATLQADLQADGSISYLISNAGPGTIVFDYALLVAEVEASQIPDGGATAMLLGLGVLGMATLRRKLS